MTTFGISQDDYLRRMVEVNKILIAALQEIRDEANRYEAYFALRVHAMANSAIERAAKL